MHGSRVGEIVRRHIDRLNGGDGTGVGVGDALLQLCQLGTQGRLIAHPRRHLPHQAGDLHSGLDEAEDVVDEQQHVPVLVIAEIFRHGQGGMPHPKARPRQGVHLAEHHHHVLQHPGRLHVTVKLLPLPAALADAAEDADPGMLPHHVVDHLGEQHRLAHPGPAEQPGLATALQGHQHVDHLDAGLEDLGAGRAMGQGGRGAMHAAPLHLGGRQPVDGMAEHVEHPRQYGLAHRGQQGTAAILHRHATGQPLSRGEGNTSHPMSIQLAEHFDGHSPVRPRLQQGMDGRERGGKTDIDDAAANGHYDATVQ